MADTVFVNNLSAIHSGSPGQSLAFPDVNLCPPAPPAGPIPTPLPNLAKAADLAGGATSVTIAGTPMAKKSSYFARSTGNVVAQSTGGGVMTHVVEGQARFVSFSMTVMAEGEPVPRHLDTMTHNHAAPMPGEAVGCYLGSMAVVLEGSPLAPEPVERHERQPIAHEICAETAGWRLGNQRYRLLSDDGSYDQVAVEAGSKGQDLVRLAFKKVLPNKTYSLFLEHGDERFPIFTDVSFSWLEKHNEAQARADGRVESSPEPEEETSAPSPASPNDPTLAETRRDPVLDVVDPGREQDR